MGRVLGIRLAFLVSALFPVLAQCNRYNSSGGIGLLLMGCELPRVSVQSGTTSSTANGSVTQTIQTINPDSSFLIFQTRHNGNRPPGSTLGGRIVDAQTIEFLRQTNGVLPEPVTIDVSWYVVSYPADCLRVQRGVTTPSATTNNTTISEISSTENAFVTFSAATDPTSNVWDNNNPVAARLTSTTNIRFTLGGADASARIYWQVIEFLRGQGRIQSGTVAIGAGTASATATLPFSVDLKKTFVLASLQGNFAGANISGRMVRARLSDANTVEFTRGGTGDNIAEAAYQVVEFRDMTTVMSGNASFASGTAAATAAITPVDPASAFPLASTMTGGGLNAGMTPYAADDIVGVSSATMTLARRELTLTRTSTADTADIQWYVVQPGRCPTCDVGALVGQ